MDARPAGVVLDLVFAPGVEDPAFARGHVDGTAAAFEAYGRLGDDGYVHAHAIGPVVALVHVLGDFSLAGEAHQAGSPGHRAETGDGLQQVGAAQQFGGGRHLADERLVGGSAAGRQQRQHGVAREFLRVVPPDALAQGQHFRRQRIGIEAQGQLDERYGELHVRIVEVNLPAILSAYRRESPGAARAAARVGKSGLRTTPPPAHARGWRGTPRPARAPAPAAG